MIVDTQQTNTLRVRWSQNPPTTPSPPRKERPKEDHDHAVERKWNMRSIQIFLFWAFAKSKLRYYLGLYTFMVTVFLHYSAGGVGTLVTEFNPEFQFHHLRRPKPAAVSVQSTLIQSQMQTIQPSTNANIVTYTIPDAAKHALEHEFHQLVWHDKDSVQSTIAFIEQAKRILQEQLVQGNVELQRILNDLVTESAETEAVIFENLPMDRMIPSTPTDGSIRLHKPTFVAEAILTAMGELAGTHVVGYKAEKQYSNPWVHEGFPRPKGPSSALTAASQVDLHQDMSYQGVIPDLLGLVCLREGQDAQVETTLVSVEKLVQVMPANVVSVLRQPRFRIEAAGWVDTNEVDITKTRSVLDGKSLHLPVHWENMVGADAEATEAIAALRKYLSELHASGLHLTDGVMVIFNNQKVIHGRTPYVNLKFDGTDRVVLRSYFVKHLDGEAKETRML
ncbi:taurine catabolism dioxygenase TauD/TfdA family protein [Nitzschia inconspicua]|uniref:Taurine catabolism dioxygenase TauD/TfdA family protein n=1 Tax=Nitzschia inconspicua TaxID=303405 RepID=A0A9K3M1D1_9STRA|nr:taurine catabolism dioxygenase TauD/TfdA family protein [Nitzschia inconspicua]